ncbi:MAG: hypothetical protein ACRDID_21750 [Ktedonobacterales bacterium]
MPPGLASECPNGIETPFTPWLPLVWIAVYILCADLFAPGLGILILRGRSAIPRRAPVSLLFVTGCALGAAAVGVWLTFLNQRFCLMAPPLVGHITPNVKADAERISAPLLAQANSDLHIGLPILALLLAVGTILAAMTLARVVRAWQARGRRA